MAKYGRRPKITRGLLQHLRPGRVIRFARVERRAIGENKRQERPIKPMKKLAKGR